MNNGFYVIEGTFMTSQYFINKYWDGTDWSVSQDDALLFRHAGCAQKFMEAHGLKGSVREISPITLP